MNAEVSTARPVRGKAAAKPAAAGMPPKAITLKFDALDKAGAVIGSSSVTTEALAPGKTASFTVKIAAPNAMAYRYSVVE